MNFISYPYKNIDFETKDAKPNATEVSRQDYKLRCSLIDMDDRNLLIFDFPNGDIYPTSTFNFVNATTNEHY